MIIFLPSNPLKHKHACIENLSMASHGLAGPVCSDPCLTFLSDPERTPSCLVSSHTGRSWFLRNLSPTIDFGKLLSPLSPIPC